MSTHLLLVVSQENPQPPVVAGGTGVASVGLNQIAAGAVGSSTGAVSMSMTAYGAKALPGAAGAATVTGERNIVQELQLVVTSPELVRAPTSVEVVVSDGVANSEVTFEINGEVIYTATTDSHGDLVATVPIPETYAAGSYTITATQAGATSTVGNFSIAEEPLPAPTVPPTNSAPVVVPEAAVVNRWVFQDLVAGGLGSYILPANPTSMTAPHVTRALTSRHTTGLAGQFHVYEGGPAPVEWQFRGYCSTQEMHDKLLAFGALNRRFYVIDHRQRAWTVTFTNVDLVPRRRQVVDGVATDWGHDYAVSALIFDQQWTAPAVPAEPEVPA